MHDLFDSTARNLVMQVESLGWRVSVFHGDGTTALGRRPSSVEMHAIDLAGGKEPQVARSSQGDREVDEAEAAVLLARAVGIDLEDG